MTPTMNQKIFEATPERNPGAGREVDSRVIERRAAGPDHEVVSVTGRCKAFRREPCGGCPWVKENAGSFPAEAFEHSARTAYDMSDHVFACHESGVKKGATCAGFLLRGADHNLQVRMRMIQGERFEGLRDGGRTLFDSYADMAVANGVDPASPILKPCR